MDLIIINKSEAYSYKTIQKRQRIKPWKEIIIIIIHT